MKNLLLALTMLVSSLVLSGCAPVDSLLDVWPKVVECGLGADQAYGDVARILTADGTAREMSDDATEALERLASKYGPGAIACLIDSLLDDWLSNGASPDPVRLAGVQRGREFLEDHGVEQVKRE